MREFNGSGSPDFSSHAGRVLLSLDPNFVYGHYQIGYRNSGFATIGGTRVGNKLYYSVALCSPNDNFSKSVGRELVKFHMQQDESSRKRGILELDSNMIPEQPAVVLKHALEVHLNKTRHLPGWTRQVVLFRGHPKATRSTYMPARLLNRTVLASGGRSMKRHEAAVKAWVTRRSK